jgi:basic membrane lipoprotein Med (substrate-binding protein (PBP1-ABC) superfamily)
VAGARLRAEDRPGDSRRQPRRAPREEAAHEIEIGDLAAADATLGRARELWRGPPLADFVYEEFAQDDIRHLNDVWLEGTETLAEVKLGLGDTTEVLTLAEAAIRQDPIRERAHEFRMLALYRAGRAADALRSYESYRRTLAEELAVEPSPRLQQLHEAILIHDPSLGVGGNGRPAAVALSVRNPYKGLRAFGEGDAGDFFGREALVQRLLETLADGTRLVTLVGPSGSGKSSILFAGLIPALRAGGESAAGAWEVTRVRPGARPFEALRTALGPPTKGQRLLLVDQLEELFEAEDLECRRALELLAGLVSGNPPQVRAVLALRADYYDRPLLHTGFAAAFLPGIVNVTPMTASELEAAIVEPSRRVGVTVEPDLLAELVAEAVDRPGALPLLELTLAELFDRRVGGELRLDDYRALGGLRGALSRRAEEVFGGFDGDRAAAARQVLLRLVRLGADQRAAACRVPVRELTELGIDPLVLSDVVRQFEANRLLTFDRDPISGDSTVEVAHEALLSGWERLARWIDQARTDLRIHAGLAHRVDEWATSGRRPEDLLAGARLEEYEAWVAGSTLRLTTDEHAFVVASRERRRVEQAELEARVSHERRLERRARVRLAGLVGAAALFVAAVLYGVTSWPGRAPEAVLVYPGPGDGAMFDGFGAGFSAAVSDLGLDAQTVIEQPETLQERLRRLCDQGARLIVVASDLSNPDVELVARDHPGTTFIASDYWGELPNVATPRFAVEEAAFLLGAAAALTSETGTVGVVGAYDGDVQWWFAGGFEAGAQEADPDVEVAISYLPEGPVTFVTVKRAAAALFEDGADVVFYSGRRYPGDWAPLGLFEAAYDASTAAGLPRWSIGNDLNWYVTLPLVPGVGRDAMAWRPHVLTSLVTRYDLAVAAMVDDFADGRFVAGERRFGLSDGVYEIATSGGFLDDLQPAIESLRDRIVDGQIEVPRYPHDRGPPR